MSEKELKFKIMELPNNFTGILFLERSTGIDPKNLCAIKEAKEKNINLRIVMCDDIEGIKLHECHDHT